MKAFVRSIFPKIVFGIVMSLCFTTAAIADTYIYDPASPEYFDTCGCHHHYRHPCARYHHKVRKVRHHYNPCYRRHSACAPASKGSYHIEVYYPQAQPVAPCGGCGGCVSCVRCAPCGQVMHYRRVPVCNRCQSGHWYRERGSNYDWDTRTADDVYSDF